MSRVKVSRLQAAVLETATQQPNSFEQCLPGCQVCDVHNRSPVALENANCGTLIWGERLPRWPNLRARQLQRLRMLVQLGSTFLGVAW